MRKALYMNPEKPNYEYFYQGASGETTATLGPPNAEGFRVVLATGYVGGTPLVSGASVKTEVSEEECATIVASWLRLDEEGAEGDTQE